VLYHYDFSQWSEGGQGPKQGQILIGKFTAEQVSALHMVALQELQYSLGVTSGGSIPTESIRTSPENANMSGLSHSKNAQ
jgi:hypothetical protein